ncbi:ATP-binding protein [Clostridioides difficile]|uniref:endopeptidase La n=2 Tax=Clostridioides difficile TaxID=1496 RepID=A0A9P3U1D9_CLODI|nr:ATP-binding protein [Clostridioides difficile]AWH76308.1 ATP-binding protein [Clostridioides difficile]AWH80084.1 ATP-binding protein [Clostridioides difficile]AXU45170.1 ATP-binding protein [Clostridioides difficile]EGT2216133.1 AAA family ATPase [Clostridioides difficile]EGT3892861.1 ATP-binding protein [Clostridioides difficile]
MKYNNTSEINPLDCILGQERAVEAMELGLKINNPVYNIYIAGEPGTGKSTYALKVLNEYASKKNTHKDWCYIYNFENPREPIIVELEKGFGRELKKDMEKLIESLLEDFKNAFESENFEIEKNKLLDEYEIEKDMLLKQIKKYGEEKGFKLKQSKMGIVFIPLKEEEDESDESDEEFYKAKRELENMAIQVVYKIRNLEEIAEKAVLELEEEIAKLVVEPHIKRLCEKYENYDKVQTYLENINKDIIEYMYLFYLDEEELKDKYDKEHFIKYKINLFVDNGSSKNKESAPVVVEINPSPANLFGKAEYDYANGNIKTDFTKLLSGAFHRANGGYLVLYADQLLKYTMSWEILKKTLQTKKVILETQTAIKPENMPLDVKLVLIGSHYIYDILYRYDEDFEKYFKVFVDFDSEMDKNEDNEEGIARFIASQCNKNDLRHFTKSAVEEVIKFSTRLSGDLEKLSTKFNKIMEVVIEGSAYAEFRNSEYTEQCDVKKAINEKRKRINRVETHMDESIENGFTLIETEGRKVGVINGLSVLSTGEYSFGRASRITATTSPGSKGIVNIEREVNMSGSIHNKGVLILGGYLSENFAQDLLLSLNAYVCFEQNYGGIDGDSASSAELYVLLSSLSGVSIKQNIAVTGSINQKGDIQVVGGISEKIEGFYSICKTKGLNGEQGVIIPRKNQRNLVLSDEVNDAVRDGKFKIYTVERVEEAIEILTDVKFEEIKKLVKEKLISFSKIQTVSKE